jgi:hypothetical protein
MKIAISNKGGYIEEGQPNPMRWMILSKNKDGSFQNESAWIKCKDFFNDYAYTYMTGKGFKIYGFEAPSMKVPKKGEPMYMLLDVLTQQWRHNMEVFNEWLYIKEMPQLKWQDHNEAQVVLEIPSKYIENTYNISLLTLIIRLLNIEHEFSTFEEAIAYKEFPPRDQGKWSPVVAANRFFALPEKLTKYVWYCGSACNSENEEKYDGYLPGVIHNNGVLSWSNYL